MSTQNTHAPVHSSPPLAITERSSIYVIREWNGRPDLASIFQEIYDSRITGRILLHVQNGRVLAVELCERREFQRVSIPAAPDLQFLLDSNTPISVVSQS